MQISVGEGIDLDSSFLNLCDARKYSMEGHWKFWGVGGLKSQ